jgi:HPt (histidine-containing phosphotransfer) domain-containing protein
MTDEAPPAFDLVHIAHQWGSLDTDIYRAVLTVVADEGAKLCGDARAALADGQRQVLERAAHTLKSAAANVGALHLSRCAEALEEAAKSGTPEVLALLMARTETAWSAVSTGIAQGKPMTIGPAADG